mmetsp:Transcript_27674/g.79881  ORF Transcript_27674/g.79881 Transcript_27674/m.79881 type:complete len:116 (-) Transcript_27674:1146-1493(-)
MTASVPAPAKTASSTINSSSSPSSIADQQQPQPTSILVHLLLWAQCAAELLCFALGLVVEALVTYVLPSREKTVQYAGRAQRMGRRAVQVVLRGLRNVLAGKTAKAEEKVKKKAE